MDAAEIRNHLTAYAATIRGHEIQDFGNKVKITDVQVVPMYRVSLETVYEKRAVVKREMKYDGSPPTQARVGERDIQLWDASLDLSGAELPKKQAEHPIPNSQTTIPCETCGRTGVMTCSSGVLRQGCNQGNRI